MRTKTNRFLLLDFLIFRNDSWLFFSLWMFPYTNCEDSLNIASLWFCILWVTMNWWALWCLVLFWKLFLKVAVTAVSIQINSVSILLLTLSTAEIPQAHILCCIWILIKQKMVSWASLWDFMENTILKWTTRGHVSSCSLPNSSLGKVPLFPHPTLRLGGHPGPLILVF